MSQQYTKGEIPKNSSRLSAVAHCPFYSQVSCKILPLLTKDDFPLLIVHLGLTSNLEPIQGLFPAVSCHCFSCLGWGLWQGSQNKTNQGPWGRCYQGHNILHCLDLRCSDSTLIHVKLSNLYYCYRKIETKDTQTWNFPEALSGILISSAYQRWALTCLTT